MEILNVDNMKTFEAILLSYNNDDDRDPSKGGFKTSDDAWDYVESFSCDLCKNDPDGIDACAAEWMVIEEDIKT